MNLRVRRLIIVSVIVLLMLLVTAGLCVLMVKLKPPKPEVGSDNPRFEVATQVIAATSVQDRIVLPAILRPWMDVTMAAQQPGRITGVKVEEGDRVEYGDILVKIDTDLPQQQLRRAEIAVREAELNQRRWEELHKSRAVSDKELDDVRIQLEQAEVSVAEAREVLAQCTVTSSLDGVVEERLVDPGEQAATGAPLVRLVDVSKLKLSVAVAENDVFYVKKGSTLTFYIDALPGREFKGEVIYVGSVASPGSNTFRVDVSVDNAAGELRAGLIARVILPRGLYRDVVAVPLDVLVPWKGQYIAYLATENVAERRVVRLKTLVDTMGIVESGLAPGEVLVVGGQRSLEDGAALDIANGDRNL